MKAKIFSYDETGFGLITSLGKRITLRGVRPVGLIQRIFENYYIYGAAEVTDGENFFPEFPNMKSDWIKPGANRHYNLSTLIFCGTKFASVIPEKAGIRNGGRSESPLV